LLGLSEDNRATDKSGNDLPMGKLIYTAIASLDGYVEDTDGSFCWSVPDEELLRFISDLERPIGTYLCGRRMCETMVYGRASNKTLMPRRFRN
jgi:hypothetical protein